MTPKSKKAAQLDGLFHGSKDWNYLVAMWSHS